MYLIDARDGKYLFTLLESCLDFILNESFYVWSEPEVLHINGAVVKFEKFMKITYRGVESSYHCEGRPKHSDSYSFDLWDDKKQEFVVSGWIDYKQNGKHMREVVTQYAIDVEAKMIADSVKENEAC